MLGLKLNFRLIFNLYVNIIAHLLTDALILQIFTIMENKPLTPIVRWLFDEQGNIPNKDLAEIVGITPQSLSRAKHGKQDLSSDYLWRLMVAIAKLRPHSDCAEFVRLIEKGKLFSLSQTQTQTLSSVIAAADDSELEMAMLQIVRRMFPKSRVNTDTELSSERVKSPVLF